MAISAIKIALIGLGIGIIGYTIYTHYQKQQQPITKSLSEELKEWSVMLGFDKWRTEASQTIGNFTQTITTVVTGGGTTGGGGGTTGGGSGTTGGGGGGTITSQPSKGGVTFQPYVAGTVTEPVSKVVGGYVSDTLQKVAQTLGVIAYPTWWGGTLYKSW